MIRSKYFSFLFFLSPFIFSSEDLSNRNLPYWRILYIESSNNSIEYPKTKYSFEFKNNEYEIGLSKSYCHGKLTIADKANTFVMGKPECDVTAFTKFEKQLLQIIPTIIQSERKEDSDTLTLIGTGKIIIAHEHL